MEDVFHFSINAMAHTNNLDNIIVASRFMLQKSGKAPAPGLVGLYADFTYSCVMLWKSETNTSYINGSWLS